MLGVFRLFRSLLHLFDAKLVALRLRRRRRDVGGSSRKPGTRPLDIGQLADQRRPALQFVEGSHLPFLRAKSYLFAYRFDPVLTFRPELRRA